MKRKIREKDKKKKKQEKYDPMQDYYDPFLCDIKVSKDYEEELKKEREELAKKMGWKK